MKANQSKIGRNDVCSCGSKKKYKKCCLLMELEDNSMPSQISERRFGKKIQRQLGDDVIILDEVPLDIKMSEIIIDIADDLLLDAKTKQQHQFAISIACTAWNLAVVFEPEQRKIEMDKFLDELVDDESDRNVLRKTISFMIEKINYYYPDIQRVVVDFELRGNRNNFHLNVASIVPKEELMA